MRRPLRRLPDTRLISPEGSTRPCTNSKRCRRDEPVILINNFTVEPEEADQLQQAWVDLRRFRGLFQTDNSARKGEHCHEQTQPTHRSFAEKLSGFLEPPMRSIPSPGSPARSVSPMAPLGTG